MQNRFTVTSVGEMRPSYKCPHCGERVRGLVAFSQALREMLTEHNQGTVYVLCTCPVPNCGPAFIAWDIEKDRTLDVYPFPDASATSELQAAIPKHILDDYLEAARCFHAKAFKATVVMARRAIQNMAVDHKIPGNLRLERQIDEMLSLGLITKNLRDSAHEIRHFGNFGAHPRRDHLNDTDDVDADAVLQLTMDFMTDLYLRPHRTSTLRVRRTQAPPVQTTVTNTTPTTT